MKKYEEQIINYLVGGVLGLIFTMPFMCMYVNFIYRRLTTETLSPLTIGSLCMLSILLLFTIAMGSVALRMKRNKIAILPSLNLYFKITPFISMFLFINILNGLGLSMLYTVIISILIAIKNYLLIRRIIK